MQRELNLLIVDDDIGFLDDAGKILSKGFNVFKARNGKEGINIFRTKNIHVVLLDVKLPDLNGLDVLSEIKKINSFTPVIIVTEFADVELAVRAMKLGANDFVQKDFNFELLKTKIEKLIEVRDLAINFEVLKESVERGRNVFIYASEEMKKVNMEIERALRNNSDFLLTGETGVGKDLIAYEIHRRSERKDKNFVQVNIAGIEPNLVESELFGTSKGAFTDAVDKIGKFQIADGGTLYISEIAEIDHRVQLKILDFLQFKTISKLGSNEKIKLDVRLIFATNADIEKLRKEGKLRDDFFYRINVYHIHIPPLRERRADIIPLAQYFFKRYLFELGVLKEVKLSDDLKDALLLYDWPGNVRELENLIRFSVDSTFAYIDEITLEHIPMLKSLIGEKVEAEQKFLRYREAEERFKENYFRELLNNSGGDLKKAAELSGLSLKGLRRILKSMGLI